jgi:hypothetical protein
VDKARFKAIIEAYGADPDRWPEAERDDALAYRRGADASETALLKDAAELDGLLAAASPARVDAALVARVMASARRPSFLAALFGGAGHVGTGARAGVAAACLALVVLGTGAGWASSGRGATAVTAEDAFLNVAYDPAVEDLFALEDVEG